MKTRKTRRWRCRCGHAIVEVRMDYPEAQFVDCHVVVNEAMLCVGCKHGLTSDRVIPEFQALMIEPKDKKAIRHDFACVCGQPYIDVLIEDPRDVNTEVDIELTPVVCGKCRQPLYGRRIRRMTPAAISAGKIIVPRSPEVIH